MSRNLASCSKLQLINPFKHQLLLCRVLLSRQETFHEKYVIWKLKFTSTGQAGARGEPGAGGLQGATGVIGLKGNAGLPGLPGLAGAKGQSGIPGLDGLPGAPGLKGDKGQRLYFIRSCFILSSHCLPELAC